LTDWVNRRVGKHKLSTGTALFLPTQSENDRDAPTWRRTNLLAGETARQRIYIPPRHKNLTTPPKKTP
jgi:hypothetical protein